MSRLAYTLPSISLPVSGLISVILIASAIAALLLTPVRQSVKTSPDFEQLVPKQFGTWKALDDPFAQVSLTTNNNDQINLLYDQVLMRTYVNTQGDQIMLALAYAREQKQDIKIHRPEVCYVAQGFQLVNQANRIMHVDASTKPVLAQRLLTRNQSRYEAVSYWIRIGDSYPSNGYAARWEILREGIKGKVLDGILVRASTAIADESDLNAKYQIQEDFLKALVKEVSPRAPKLLVAD